MDTLKKDIYVNPFSAYGRLDFYPVETFQKKISKIPVKFSVSHKAKKRKKRNTKKKFPIEYTVQQSFMTYTCNVSKLECVCSKGSRLSCCIHLAYVLENYLNLDYFLIYMIFNDKIAQEVYLANVGSLSGEKIPAPKEDLADKIFNALKKEYEEEECIICSESLFENFDKIFDCKQCKKFIHSECAQQWYAKQVAEEKKLNKPMEKGCALCRKKFSHQFSL